jgi:hypothetical protein
MLDPELFFSSALIIHIYIHIYVYKQLQTNFKPTSKWISSTKARRCSAKAATRVLNKVRLANNKLVTCKVVLLDRRIMVIRVCFLPCSLLVLDGADTSAGLDFIEKKTGHTMGRDTNEKITDGVRGMYEKATGYV